MSTFQASSIPSSQTSYIKSGTCFNRYTEQDIIPISLSGLMTIIKRIVQLCGGSTLMMFVVAASTPPVKENDKQLKMHEGKTLHAQYTMVT